MLKISVDVKDHKKIAIKLGKISSRLKKNIFGILVEGAMETRNEMIESMKSSPPIGRKYPSKANSAIIHTASAPGYPPRPDMENLIASIIPDVRENEMEVEVGSIINNPPYPVFLEEPKGKTDWSNLQALSKQQLLPRPFAWPALEKQGKVIESKIMQAIIKSAK